MIVHRPFRDGDDLGRVERIGETRLSRLRPLVTSE
jgi:DNA uptake protein ComE-like DNA-binding protein